jgi:alginate O-acetyltransferase complex protein AlgI
MNFNSVEFLLFFLPLQLALFYLAPARLRLLVLLGGSIFFYGMSGDMAGFLLLVTVIWAGLVGTLGPKLRHGWLLAIALLPPFGFLYLFKYLDFTLAVVDPGGAIRPNFGPILQFALPAGISFYTFQIAAYLIDIHDNKIERERNLILFATFASFFPQLIAGPILRYTELRDQLLFISTAKKLSPDVARGLKYLSVGLAYKIFFADILRHFQETHSLEAGGGSLDAGFAVFAYSFIIYFDFWGYSLMAIGLANLFCIELPRNFLEPYMSLSPKAFWRRWHVTLSYWIRDYLYLKLGGNRFYVRNIIIIFLAVGIWHGAGWNFLVWGGYHAILVIGYHVLRSPWDALPKPLQIFLTFVLVSLGWPLFYTDIGQYLAIMTTLFSFEAATGISQFGVGHWLYLALVACVVFGAREDRWLFNTNPHRLFDHPITHALTLFVSILFLSYGRTFIYFQF